MTKFLAIFSLVIIVLLAFGACGEESIPTPAPAAQAIEAEVQRSVAAALADQSAGSIREDAMSTEDISALVQEVIGAQAPEGISPEQIQSAIERAVSEAPQGLSESQVQAVVANALERSGSDSEAMMMEPEAVATPASTPAPAAASAPRVTAMPTPALSLPIPSTPAPTATPSYRAPSTPVPMATAVPASRSTGTPTPPPAAVGTPSATTFQDYLRERFVSTAADAVSTFSLDTDRTSYHLALNWARTGYAVDPDSVRAEEWINAFDYQYDPPLRNDSFSISSDVFRHPLESGMHMARIAFQAPEPNYDTTPVNVTLVLDASGSMDTGNRVAIAREAAESIRRSLRSHDRIAVVHFSTDVLSQYTVDHRPSDDPAVARSISQLDPHSSTNVQAGLNRGVQLADRARRQNPNAYNYIILMSDGVANVDATDPFAILESAGDYDSSNPLRLITIGVGIENYNDYLLEQLAQHGNGWYRYLSDTNQARATFTRENWLALSVPFADQTRAQVTWDPNMVESWRIVGYENRITSDESFTQARREFAEIPAGAATTVFYELELTNTALRGNARLGEVELRWVTPATGESNRQHSTIFGQGDVRFSAVNNPLLQLGALVALSSDRYSSLPYADSSTPSVHRDLLFLTDELRSLDSQLGDLGAYQDMYFLIEHITRDSRGFTTPSGYSP